MNNDQLLRLNVGTFALAIAPFAVRADVMGTTAASAATQAGGPDDMNFASTTNVSFQSFCSFLLNGGQTRLATVNFTFAGFGNIGSLFQPIVDSESDFNISVYQPWVVNNFATLADGTNFLTDPSSRKVARNVQNQDVGGANVVINYTPRADSTDPTNVNFVQAFVQNTNNNNPVS